MFSRKTTFITAALEAALVVAVSLGILLVPITVLWAVENNATVDWTAAYRASVDIWLAAHGVPIQVTAQVIAGVSVPAFVVAIAPLGYSAIILAMTFRMGQRLANSRALWPGWLGAVAVYGTASLLLSDSAKHQLAAPDARLGAYLPTFVFALVLVASSLFAKPVDIGIPNQPLAMEREQFRDWLKGAWEGLGWWANVVTPPAVRAGTAIVVMLLGFSALVLGLSLAINWIEVIRLYESLQLTLLGGVFVTIGQILFLPNFVVYAADWFTGAGFAIGTGSSATPLETNLGPIPSLPILAALPTGHLSLGLFVIAVPMIAALVATISIRAHAGAMRYEFASPVSAALSLGIPVAIVAALELLVLNLLARGAIGPGRLADVGGNPLTTAAALFAEVAVVSTIAAFYTASPDAPDTQLIERARTTIVSRGSTAQKPTRPMTSTPVDEFYDVGQSGFEPEER